MTLGSLGQADIFSDAARLRTVLEGPSWLTTPLTSTSWDGDAKTTGDNGTIDLSAVFSVPAKVKAVLVRMTVQDETPGVVATLRQSSGALSMLSARIQVVDIPADETGWVPCDANGDFYFQTSGELDAVSIVIWAYWR